MATLRRIAGSLVVLAALTAVWPVLVAAVLVAPHAVFISHRTRTAQVELFNTGNAPEEVSVELAYGYPDTDSAGNVFLRMFEVPPADQPASTSWMRAFPRRVVVPPGQRQTVRILAQPPANLDDGEYWTRMVVTSREAAPPAGPVDSGQVRAGLSVEIRTVISVSYRKGALRTGLTLTDFRTGVERDSLVTWFGLRREGNAAYLGTASVELRDARGRVAGEWSAPMGVYFSQLRRVTIPVADLPRGQYTVQFAVTTAREDISPSDVLPAEPVRRAQAVELR